MRPDEEDAGDCEPGEIITVHITEFFGDEKMNTAHELQHALRYIMQKDEFVAETIMRVIEAAENGPLSELDAALFRLKIDCRQAAREYRRAKELQEKQRETLQSRTDAEYTDPAPDEEWQEEDIRRMVKDVA